MPTTFQITHTVRVSNNHLFLNDMCLFKGEGSSAELVVSFYQQLNISYPKFFKMDLMSKWGWLCAEVLMQHEDLQETDPYKKVMVMQNSSASSLADINFQDSVDRQLPSPALFVYTLPNIVMGEIAIRHHFKGENTFFVVPSYDEKQLHDYLEILFGNQTAEVAIAGYLELNDKEQNIVMYVCRKK